MACGGVFAVEKVAPGEGVVAPPRPLAASPLALLAPSPLPPRAPARGLLDAPLTTPPKWILLSPRPRGLEGPRGGFASLVPVIALNKPRPRDPPLPPLIDDMAVVYVLDPARHRG